MSEKYKFVDPEGIYFVTPTITAWIDIFTKPEYSEILVESLRYCQKEKGLIVHAWCIMSSHLHLIVSSRGDKLSSIFRDFKAFTSKQITKQLYEGSDSRKEWMLSMFSSAADKIKRNIHYKVWQDGNHPVLLDTNRMMEDRLNYLHQNPVEQGIVSTPEYYIYSSAQDYAGDKGPIDRIIGLRFVTRARTESLIIVLPHNQN